MEELTVSSDAPGKKLFMLGNEAIARGAIEAGVQVAAAYPGTPSTEIMETLVRAAAAKEVDMYVEWSTNEKVAFEVALGASLSGVRAMASMKQAGVNVAHDVLLLASYAGTSGLVLVQCEEPSTFSSQNEQDNRYVAEQAYIPVLEPSSVQEAKDMIPDAFKLSEEFKHIFMVRPVTRIDHARSSVTLGEILREKRVGFFKRDPYRLVAIPATVKENRPLMIERFERIRKAVNTIPYNQLKLIDGAKLSIIACGLLYSYALEAIKWLGLEDRVSVLKIGTPHPLPEELVKRLLNSAEEVLVLEEPEPFVENHVKAIARETNFSGEIHGKDIISLTKELSTRVVMEAIAKLTDSELPIDFAQIDKFEKEAAQLMPPRPPALCVGCPHRASLYAIKTAARRVARDYGKDVTPIFSSDIGCYGLGYMPPLEAADTAFAMGSSFGVACGLSHAVTAPIVAYLGDSTFFHAGIPAFINAVYNRANITMVVLDNSTTAATGFQPHPGTGYTATGDETIQIKPEDIATACGVKFVEVVNPFDLKKTTETIEKAIRFDGPSFVVSRMLCAIVDQREKRKRGEKTIPYYIDQERCSEKCNACIELFGCLAIVKEDSKTVIDRFACTGCGVCAQICPHNAIKLQE